MIKTDGKKTLFKGTDPERYFYIIVPILWTEATKKSLYNCRSVVCYLIPDAWAYRAKKEVKKRAGCGLGIVLLSMYLHNCNKWGGLLRQSCDHNQEILGGK